MDFYKIGHLPTYTTREYFAFLMKLLIVLAVLVSPFFSTETVVGKVSPNHETIRQQQKLNILAKGNGPTYVLDFEKQGL